MLSSNTHITVIAPTKQLAHTVKLACALCGLSSKEPITHYAIVNLPMADLHNARSGQSVKELANHPDASQTLLLFTRAAPEATPLPWAQTPETLPSFVESWLEQARCADPDPHFDGLSEPNGFMLTTNQYGTLAGSYNAILAIQKTNMEYAK